MSVCGCWSGDWPLGACVMRSRTARAIPKRGNRCPNCGCAVEIGQRCIDYSGLDGDGNGFFDRFHEQCFLLMEMFGEKVCRGGWHYPFDLDEAAEHAAAEGHDPYWRDWLLLYEQTWAWRPEPKED